MTAIKNIFARACLPALSPASVASRRLPAAALAFLLLSAICHLPSATASNVIIAYTNSSTGTLDTNTFKLIPVSNVQNADGTWNTIGLPRRVTPGTNGYSTNYLVQNTWLLTNPVTGFWETLSVLDSSSNLVNAGSISRGQNSNPYLTQIFYNTNTGSGGIPNVVTNDFGTNNGTLSLNTNSPTVTAIAQTVANAAYVPQATNALALQGVTLDSFGAKPDGQIAYLLSCTNGSQFVQVQSASAAFSSADVGKWMTVYYNAVNSNWINSPIIAVVSPTQVQLSNACTVTATGVMGHWGTDSAAAMQAAGLYCITNHIPNLQASAGIYTVIGNLNYTGSNNWDIGAGSYCQNGQIIYSILNWTTPAYHSYTTTNAMQNFRFTGVNPSVRRVNGYFSGLRSSATNNGTVIFCPAIGTHNGPDYLLSFTSTNNNYSQLNATIENIEFIRPNWATIGYVDNTLGGSISINNCQFSEDWNGTPSFGGGFGIYGTSSAGGEGWGNTNVFDVHLACNSNNGNQKIDHCDFAGGYNGIYTSDHGDIQNTVMARYANALANGNGLQCVVHALQFDVCLTNVWQGCENGGASMLLGDMIFSADENNPHHGVFKSLNYNPNFSGSIQCDFGSQFNLVTSAGEFANAHGFNVLFGGLRQEYGSPNNFQVKSNYYGATYSDTHFPYGVMTAQFNSGTSLPDFNVPMVFGGQYSAQQIGIYGESFFQQEYMVYPFNGLYWNYTNGVTGMYLDRSGNLSIAGTFTGNGANITNAQAASLVANPASVNTAVVAITNVGNRFNNVTAVGIIGGNTNGYTFDMGTDVGNGDYAGYISLLDPTNGADQITLSDHPRQGINLSGDLTYTGNGSNLTSLNPASFMSGTNTANLGVGSISGSGSGLTGLNASQLTSGTAADARLNVADGWILRNTYGIGPTVTASSSQDITNYSSFFGYGFTGSTITGLITNTTLSGYYEISGSLSIYINVSTNNFGDIYTNGVGCQRYFPLWAAQSANTGPSSFSTIINLPTTNIGVSLRVVTGAAQSGNLNSVLLKAKYLHQ